MSAPPTAAPPANFFDKKPLGNYHSTIYGVCITLLGLCWLTTSFRLWTRFRITKTPGWDDFFVVLTLIVITMGTIAFCVATRYGLGEHVYLIDFVHHPTYLNSFLKCHYIIGASYTSSTALIKISLLLQYLRIFERGRWIYRLTQGIMIFVAMWGLAYSFTSWLCCLPTPAAFWNLTYKGCYGFASSSKSQAVSMIKSHASVNMALDFIVLTLPVHLLFKEGTQAKTKKGLLVLLFVGCLITAFSVWRLATIVATQAGFYPVLDPTWNEPESTLLSFVEVYIAAICASTPVFWPIIEAQIAKIFVMYEFNVSTESRYVYDEIEVAHTGSFPLGNVTDASYRSRPEMDVKKENSLTQESLLQDTKHVLPADPFRTQATVQADPNGKRTKERFVRVDSPPQPYEGT